MRHARLRHSFEVEDVVGIVRMTFAERVVFHDGDAELSPGVTLHACGGHSMGLQCVRVSTARGPVVLASDVSHFYENMESGRPFTTAFHVGDMLEGFDRLRALAPSPRHIVRATTRGDAPLSRRGGAGRRRRPARPRALGVRRRAVARLPRRAALLAAALALPTRARAQAFPNRPVKIVVPFPPGGAADITARLLGEQMAPLLGQAVVVENRPGAGGNIAAEAVARAAPDGHTAFWAGDDPVRQQIPVPQRDALRRAAGLRARFPRFGRHDAAGDARRPAVARLRRDGGGGARAGTKLSAGNSGLGTISHLSLSKLAKEARIEISHVPYRGLAPSLNDLLAGNLDLIFDGIPPSSRTCAKAGCGRWRWAARSA
jgi:glyoxylase-like metal-dependent hydrolase (beta-lactamase superfamily II)